MSERSVEVDGRRVFMRERGNGAPLVLLHGFPQTGDCWAKVADKLSGRNRVLIPDLPGFGQSDPAPTARMADLAAHLVAALETQGARTFALAGHDWGGSIALRIALDHPERVERLVVINAPFRHLDLRHGWHFLLFNLPLLPEAALVLAGRQLVPLMIKAGSANKRALDGEALRAYGDAFSDLAHARQALAYYRTITRSVIARRVRASAARLPLAGRLIPKSDAPREARRVSVPTLIVWGDNDPALPPSLIGSIEKDVDDCTVVRLPDVGHFVPEEAPSELAHEIDRFLHAP